MSEFALRIEPDLPVGEVWARLWDVERQSAVIPLTRVRLDPPATRLGPGAGFTGRTAVGPLGFDDTMRVDEWSPPSDEGSARAVVVKTGRVVGGRIEVTVRPLRQGCCVEWRQTVHLPWLPARLRPVERLAAWVARPGYRWTLRTLLA